MTCGSCGTENPAGAKFCIECGAGVVAGCPGCGAPVVAGAKFCAECGTPLAPGLPALPRPSVRQTAEAERRVVSVLFADLVGFTTLAEGRDAEETRELLSRYFDLSTEVVTRYGGTIEKFIGDAVMAVWGAPIAREDDAERAVRAALELVDAVRSLGPTISARAGVLTGEAAVTLGAVNQGMVAGDLVNTASRLQSAAPPGMVLVGDATQRASAAAIVFEPAGEQLLKGKVAPVNAWRAVRVVAEVGGRNRAGALEAPFVGRDDELRMLKDLFHATARERRVRLVSIIGPAGIGKSRLAWEFLKYIDGLVDGVWWHQGRSPSYGHGLTFWALGEMVRARCELLENEEEPVVRARVAETVARHVPDAAERAWIEAALLALLGVGGAASRSEELFAAWRTFFERMAATDPVVMVFEDLHWADSGTLDFIDHLLDWSRGLPICVVTLARPELLERRTDWGAGTRNFTSLSLEPLPAEHMRALLSGLVPGLPADSATAIIARADGIPLYAVETVRMLVGQGRLELHDGIYVPTGDLTSLSVPESLTALIAARLDALDAADRALVQDAAVVGLSFTLGALAAVSGQEGAELEGRLRPLVRRELFRLESDPRSPERGQYVFVQALIREVAYSTLARRDRKTRHLAAARYFEASGTDESAGALAGHYLSAHQNAPEGPEAEALAGQARLALAGAADRAAGLGAHGQALAFRLQALTVTDDPADEAALRERAADAASAIGRYDDAESQLQLAVELHRAAGDRAATARALAQLGAIHLRARRHEAALAVLEPAVAEFADLFPTRPALELETSLAHAYGRKGDTRAALALSERVLEAAELADEVEIVARTLITRGTGLCTLGRTYEGLAIIEAGGRLSEAHGLQEVALTALGQRAVFLGGDPRTALEVERAALALARRLGRRSGILVNTQNAAEDAMRTGDWDWAIEQLEALVADAPTASERSALLAMLAAYAALRGAPVEGLEAEIRGLAGPDERSEIDQSLLEVVAVAAFADGRLDVASDAWRAIAVLSPVNAPYVLPRSARALLWARRLDEVEHDLDAFRATGLHGPASIASRQTINAGLAALRGAPDEALRLFRDALRGWRDLGLPWDTALTGMDMAFLLDVRIDEVRAAAETSRRILADLRARPLLERLEAALAEAESSVTR